MIDPKKAMVMSIQSCVWSGPECGVGEDEVREPHFG